MLNHKEINFRVFRFFEKLSTQELIDLLGTTRGGLSDFQSGNRPITLKTLEKIKPLMNCSWDYLLEGIENTPGNKAFASIHGTMQWQGNMKNVFIQIFDKQ